MKGKESLVKNKKYTRAKIRDLVGGGELQSYLPQKNHIILAGCFNKELNPNCPTEIQVGSKPKVKNKAELLIEQQKVFPVFIKDKKSDKNYTYQGRFRCTQKSQKTSVLKEAENRSGRHGQLSYVLTLEKISD